jgi:hypothetical protein
MGLESLRWNIISVSYLCAYLDIDKGIRLKSELYDKRDEYHFPIVNFPFISKHIPAASVYGVYISPLIRNYNSNTVIFWKNLSCWRKNCSNKTTLIIIDGNHRYKYSRSSLPTGWPLRNIHFAHKKDNTVTMFKSGIYSFITPWIQ